MMVTLWCCAVMAQTPTTSNPTPTTSPTPTTGTPEVDGTVPTGVTQGVTNVFDPGPRPAGTANIRFIGGTSPCKGVPDVVEPAGPAGPGAGDVVNNITANETGFWFAALAVFGTTATVKPATDPLTCGPSIVGLGPGFNGESCFQCHSQPTIGGSSPASNPQITAAHDKGATNVIPSFISSNGPVLEARFVFNADGTLDGGVHELFSIQGRSDATGCTFAQPDFQTQLTNNNIIFRIPIPTFGEGFVENTSELNLETNLASLTSTKSSLGINGRFNRSGNDSTITRFGWKAQNKSLLMFAGEAANVEMGVTNELFGNEKFPNTVSHATGCDFNPTPEDFTNPDATVTGTPNPTADPKASDIENFTVFMRFNAPPQQCDYHSGTDSNGNALCKALSAEAANGKAIFGTLTQTTVNGVLQPPKIGIGCVLCHSDVLNTGSDSPFNGSNVNAAAFTDANFAPFSDFALHHMGATLTDGVNQGLAGPDEFRTAPLWGLGQRLFFMHDGHDTSIVQAILDHETASSSCTTINTPGETFILNGQTKTLTSQTQHFCGSEANAVIGKFKALTVSQQQDLMDFLRSL
ncbi:MAG TPA: di-heme oxidoredictase family protein [Candidatus Angelobacter sp.]|nr:di-heme oxidoredictase family protein [Candidatus Angelobacter sp.]